MPVTPGPNRTRPAPAPAPVGPAARNRLNLIELISAEAVVSDYAGSVDTPAPSSRRQRVLVAAISLAVTGFVLAMGISARVLNAPAVADQRSALLERVLEQEAIQEELTGQVTSLRAQAEAARAKELANVAGGAALAVQIGRFELATGFVAVTGPGVLVTLTDATGDDADPELGVVLDSDLQRAVNGLWQAGAEAIAVNGQRLTSRSAIRSAAGAVLVNYRPLRPPYLVSAIGDPATLLDQFLATGDAAALSDVSQQFGIGFTTQSLDKITLPAASSTQLDHAQVATTEQGDTR